MTGSSRNELPGLDLGRLARWFDTELPGARSDELGCRVIAGGRSNLTYLVEDGVHRWVLRRPPLGHVLSTAHDMSREFRVISALQETAVPVPATYELCSDPEVLGAPFYVMEYVDGTPYREDWQLEPLGPERTAAIGRRVMDVLAALHGVDAESIGLANFGRPEGFLERQVRRWGAQLDASHSRDLAGIDELRARLAAKVPETLSPAIVHGDYRLDNVLIDEDDQIAAVLDWEMSTLGDPLSDVALLVVYQRSQEFGAGAAVATFPRAPGWPSEAELLERYATASGRDLGNLWFHLALAAFKAAVILEGIHYRYVHGQTVGSGFDGIGDMVEPMVAIGLDSLEEHY
ncbi:phosphotransferase family protein [Nonomuraea lactucae]|uniref:phosphotransferase family protein n=1 Tax=Nonomuraea lactucae TaxID=2249762 RepID=UPI001F07034F|nr:phosphotransferase family protein [Nonomuraea lactucae]